ncbi:DUF3850 domain-containing protein [Massilia sp. P8910]|uniref:DUF3850 domain-containing protein n=1 Tax=Massilia antarctica TaxID=2765360 RepID=UPI001E653493|nr:DUF3850 domain-containing protein [Massilia antarctica]MCE3602762.1 DUF3850 domain-containing protein [Massilia antarctica]
MLNTHELKTDPAAFAAVIIGTKTHEIRPNDRGFQAGDELLLRETLHSADDMRGGAPLIYTGRCALRDISHVQGGPGLLEGWVVLSFKEYKPAPVVRRRRINDDKMGGNDGE